jgi:hypothetical protein
MQTPHPPPKPEPCRPQKIIKLARDDVMESHPGNLRTLYSELCNHQGQHAVLPLVSVVAIAGLILGRRP